MQLIIGKNSRIIKEIRERLINFDFISHDSVCETNFNIYDRIYLFSWNHNGDNLDLIRFIPANKLVFISSIAVLSTYFGRQYSRYPNEKFAVEKFVLENFGAVIRIGIWDHSEVNKLYGLVPITTPKDLISILNENNIENGSVLTPFVLVSGGVIGIKKKIFSSTKFFINPFLKIKLFSYLIALLGRILRINNYGYTGDALLFFNESIQIGFGAFGGYYYKKINNSNKIVVSNCKNNIELNDNGFNGTLIGKTLKGLSSLWHGVYVTNNDGIYKKKLLRFGKSFSIPKNSIYANISSINNDGNYFILNIESAPFLVYQIFCKKLYLAAGSIENARLLKSISNVCTTFDDHELAMVGTVNTSEIIRNKMLIKVFSFFISYSQSLLIKSIDSEFLVDFRPVVTISGEDDLDFYNTNLIGILKRLFYSRNISRFNEAFFCRFGLCFATKKTAVYVQALSKNSITFDEDFKLTRLRLGNIYWENIDGFLLKTFPSYIPCIRQSIDAQHIWGGSELLNSEKIKNLVSKNLLTIIGSPSIVRLGATHHTVNFRRNYEK